MTDEDFYVVGKARWKRSTHRGVGFLFALASPVLLAGLLLFMYFVMLPQVIRAEVGSRK
jgi:hypothetical protein